MKSLRLLISAGVLFGLANLAAAKTERPKTYSLYGFCAQGKPSDELVQLAAKAVETRMAGMTLTGSPEDAEHYVEVLFRRDSFEIYVDALPIAGQRLGSASGLPYYPVQANYSWERAADAHCPPAPCPGERR